MFVQIGKEAFHTLITGYTKWLIVGFVNPNKAMHIT
jgi:hypothetical protein